MTLLSTLRDLAAEEQIEWDIENARETESQEQRIGLAAMSAVAKVLRDRWGITGPEAPGPVAYFEHLGWNVEVRVERDEKPAHEHTTYRRVRRVLVEVADLTFVALEDRHDGGWWLPVIRMGRFCPTCGTVVQLGRSNDLRPVTVMRLLEGPTPEHKVGTMLDRTEVCDGQEVRLAPEPAAPRPDQLAELAVPSESVLAELAAEGWEVSRWLGVNTGTPATAIVVLRDTLHDNTDEEPF